MKQAVIAAIAFAFGLSCFVSYRLPYYEMRGYVIVEQRLLNVRFVYSWADVGFSDKYPPEWDITRTDNSDVAVTNWRST